MTQGVSVFTDGNLRVTVDSILDSVKHYADILHTIHEMADDKESNEIFKMTQGMMLDNLRVFSSFYGLNDA